MVNQADEPLKKVTLFIYESDYHWFNENTHPGLMAVAIRDALRRYVNKHKVEADERD